MARENQGGKEGVQEIMLKVIGKALAAEAAGKSEQATMLFKICKGLGNTITSVPTTSAHQSPTQSATDTGRPTRTDLPIRIAAPPISSSTAPPAIPTPPHQLLGFKVPASNLSSIPKVRDYDEMLTSSGPEAAALFDNAAIPNNDNIGLPQFFAKNLLEFRAPLPLTIFNEWWQEQAFLHHAEKRSKSDDASGDRFRYTGFLYPSKYLQTYQEWLVNHQGFLRVCKIPSHANLATWLVAHKRNADGIIRREGFMTALRVPVPGGRLSVANISIFWTEIVQEVHAKTVRSGETEFTNNPYAAGGCCFGWDPTTGQQAKVKGEQANRTPLHLQQSNKAITSATKPGPETPRGPSNQKETGGKGNGFKGGKWGQSY
ncbi:hypothetical protein PTTG_07016, partial [Puccinia triticina 1-1 BBBD Race 1]